MLPSHASLRTKPTRSPSPFPRLPLPCQLLQRCLGRRPHPAQSGAKCSGSEATRCRQARPSSRPRPHPQPHPHLQHPTSRPTCLLPWIALERQRSPSRAEWHPHAAADLMRDLALPRQPLSPRRPVELAQSELQALEFVARDRSTPPSHPHLQSMSTMRVVLQRQVHVQLERRHWSFVPLVVPRSDRISLSPSPPHCTRHTTIVASRSSTPRRCSCCVPRRSFGGSTSVGSESDVAHPTWLALASRLPWPAVHRPAR